MYPAKVSNPEQHRELLKHKEFASLKISQNSRTDIDKLIDDENILRLRSYQKFPKYFMSPSTPYKRMCLKFAPGTGKTATVLALADEYINYYYSMWEKGNVVTPSVIIIGFSKQIFMRELFKRPEFGFITREEIEKERKLRTLAENGTRADRDALTEFYTILKKRLTKKSQRGFFKFYGYKEFFNRLFIFTNVEKLEELLGTRLERNSMSEDDILLGLQHGYIKINIDIADEFINSLVICDEIHNVYNSLTINNYGIALRIAFMIQDIPDYMEKYVSFSGKLANGMNRNTAINNSRLRVILLSATPLNNSPTEIIDFINLLIDPRKLLNSGKIRIEKNDIFKNQKELHAHGLEKIQKLLYGHVLFLEYSNPEYFPELRIKGQTIPIPKNLENKYNISGTVPYLKFQRCKISKLHLNTYRNVYDGTLPPDGTSLLDIAFPNPDSNELGIFKTRDVKYKISSASRKWKDKIGIDIMHGKTEDQWYLSGEFLELKNLRKYSSKYARLVELLHENLYTKKGKVIINHPAVKMSGVLLLQEILKKNGFIDSTSSPVDNTLCARCGYRSVDHKKQSKIKIKHDFYPARFIVLHGELDKMELARNVEKFKSWNNLDGDYYKITIGSRVINEGIDFSEVREVYITSFVDNYSELIQIVGRAIRQGSHTRLSEDKRNVDLHILTTCLDNNKELFHEERRYLEKSIDYKIIQKIERAINEIALDGPINKNIIKPETLTLNGLRRLKYSVKMGVELNDLKTITQEIFHIDNEKADILYIIKRLYIEISRIWKYQDLWHAVQNPPFHVNVNTKLFSEAVFKIVLEKLLYSENIEINKSLNFVDYLFDSKNYTLIINGQVCKIVYISEYYAVMPMQTYTHVSKFGKSKKKIPVNFMENWFRMQTPQTHCINITEKLKTNKLSYHDLKMEFYKKYNNAKIKEIPKSIEIYGLDFHINLVQEAIIYIFQLLTSSIPQSEFHHFYIKVLYFYSSLDLVIYADQIPGYEKYTTEQDSTDKKLNKFLISSLENTLSEKDLHIERFNKFAESLRTQTRKTQTSKTREKVPASLLPVGHFITNFKSQNLPVKWNVKQETWEQIFTISDKKFAEKENSIIIGFFELNPLSLELRFKLRANVNDKKKEIDVRKTEKGMVCSTYKKQELLKIAEQLNIEVNNDNVREICTNIKIELLRREIKSRKNPDSGKLRWFYMHFETQPINF